MKNLFQLTVPEVRVEERTFYSVYQPQRDPQTKEVLRDPDTGEVLLVPFTFRLRGCEEVLRDELLARGMELVERHITGSKAKGIQAAPVLIPGGKPVKLSRSQCRIFAIAMGLDAPRDPANEEERLNVISLAYFARAADDAYVQFAAWVTDLFNDPYERPALPESAAGSDPGNGSGAASTPA